jgi:hypothetical protein
MKTISMSHQQWAQIQDNPIQRNTEAHAAKATKGHLQRTSTSQALVHAARLPDGTLVKLDGHTRGLLWSDGRLPAPSAVLVAVHDVHSMADAVELYKEFDSPMAVEGATDRLSGAYRFHGITPSGKILVHGGITSALNLLNRGASIYESVGDWKQELLLLDEIDAAPAAMPAVVICAALATLRRHGPTALEFWRLYAAGSGTRIDGKSDGVDELTRIVADLRARKTLGSGSWANRLNQAGRAISCCDAWLQTRSYTKGAKATDVRTYVDTAIRSKLLFQRRAGSH